MKELIGKMVRLNAVMKEGSESYDEFVGEVLAVQKHMIQVRAVRRRAGNMDEEFCDLEIWFNTRADTFQGVRKLSEDELAMP
jgi:hypothetical protein